MHHGEADSWPKCEGARVLKVEGREGDRESVGIPGYTQDGIVRKRRIFLGRKPTALELEGRW